MQLTEIDKWLRAVWGFMILVTLCVGAFLFLSTNPNPSLNVFIPSGIVGGALFVFEILMYLRNQFPQHELPTWISVFMMTIAASALFLGLTEANDAKRTGYFTFAGTVFGLGSGIPIGKLTAKSSRKRKMLRTTTKP